jgi:protein subunit release factor A
MGNVIIEVRAAEGGDDAKNLVVEQFRIYGRLCGRRGL